jgi:hypothetical protein
MQRLPHRASKVNATVLQPTASVKTVQFNDQTFAHIDLACGLVTLHKGVQVGRDEDWGGQVIASIPLDNLVTIAKVAIGGDPIHAQWVLEGEPVPVKWFTQPDSAYVGAAPVEYRDEFVGF